MNVKIAVARTRTTEYALKTTESYFQFLGLSQSEFVGIAILSGGDYSSGLAGVGVVSAIELLSEFATTRSSDDDSPQEAEVFLFYCSLISRSWLQLLICSYHLFSSVYLFSIHTL